MSFLIFYQNERMGQRELTKIEGNFGVILRIYKVMMRA